MEKDLNILINVIKGLHDRFDSKAKAIAKRYNPELTLNLKGLKWIDVGNDYFQIGTIYSHKIADTIRQLEKEQRC
ncbi:hypothetical protein HpBT060_15180 [Helicobacter pylori]